MVRRLRASRELKDTKAEVRSNLIFELSRERLSQPDGVLGQSSRVDHDWIAQCAHEPVVRLTDHESWQRRSS